MRTEIILIKYNIPDYEARCISSIMKYTHVPGYSLTAYQNKKGIGLATAWNRLIDKSDAEYICLLNTDTIVTDYWLEHLLDSFKLEDNIGAVSPSSNKAYGVSGIKPPLNDTEKDVDKINDFGQTYWNENKDKLISAEMLSGFCFVFPKKVWTDVGGFDERFFLYKEDKEWFLRLKQDGYRLYCRRGVYVHHYHNVSIRKAHKEREFNNTIIARNSNIIFKKIMEEEHQRIVTTKSKETTKKKKLNTESTKNFV